MSVALAALHASPILGMLDIARRLPDTLTKSEYQDTIARQLVDYQKHARQLALALEQSRYTPTFDLETFRRTRYAAVSAPSEQTADLGLPFRSM